MATGRETEALDLEVIVGDYAMPGNQPANYSLVRGKEEALLVDVPFARSDAHRLIAAILRSGKRLSSIYITHDHPDHFFNLDIFKETFPEAKIVTHRTVVADMKRSIPLKFARWAEGLGDNAPQHGVVPDPLPDDELRLEDITFKVIGPMQGDHLHATALWEPRSRTLIAGDLLYNGVYLFLGEHRPPQYDDWLASLDVLEALEPKRIVAGHSKPGLPDDSFAIDWSRRYLHAFKAAREKAASAEEMATILRAAFPNAISFPGNDFLLEVSTQVATGEIEPWDE